MRALHRILLIVMLQVQQGASGSWRCHIQAIHNLTTMHGGISSLAGHTGLDPLLLAFMLYVCRARPRFLVALQES